MKTTSLNTAPIDDCPSGCPNMLYKKHRVNFTKSKLSILSSLAIVLLPKCPFCIVAYSSAMTLCSAKGVFTDMRHHTGWGAYIALGTSVIITLYMLSTQKDKNGGRMPKIGCALGVFSSLLLYLAIFRWHTMNIYYTATILLIAATMMHSGFYKRILYMPRPKQLQKSVD